MIVDLHRLGYAAEGDRFGPHFWNFVAGTVAEAQLEHPGRSRIWLAEFDGLAVGCSALVDRGDVGQLRWVVLLPQCAARARAADSSLLRSALRARR